MYLKLKDSIRRLHVAYLRFRSSAAPSLSISQKRILLVAPHPDDEVIGCGGLIARLVGEGNPPQILIMTGGEGSHHGCCHTPETEIMQARRGLTLSALRILGVPAENLHTLNYPDGGIAPEHPETEAVKRLLTELNPEVILVPHWGEGWSDHVTTATILKQLAPKGAKVYEYCVWMWFYNIWRGLDWKHAALLRMTPEEHRLKLAAMDAYIRPLAPCGKPWSGVLPEVFVEANRWNKELYFEVR